MRRVAAVFMVLFLSWSLFPGGFELAENVYHLAVHGDFAHQSSRSGHLPFNAPLNTEHGCGGGFHLCSCCHVQPSVTTAVSVLPAAPATDFFIPHGGSLRFASGFPSLPQEPPRA